MYQVYNEFDRGRGTVMVFDEDALPLTRSWCLFELLQTHHFSAFAPRTGSI